MPAYRIPLRDRKCDTCKSKAKYEVFNNRNASFGDYCAYHAARKVNELNENKTKT